MAGALPLIVRIVRTVRFALGDALRFSKLNPMTVRIRLNMRLAFFRVQRYSISPRVEWMDQSDVRSRIYDFKIWSKTD